VWRISAEQLFNTGKEILVNFFVSLSMITSKNLTVNESILLGLRLLYIALPVHPPGNAGLMMFNLTYMFNLYSSSM
jgi:hypothetical protein